ncbi:MAG: N-6 DNA methylase [candidate division Zixibacteria bacterium]|nr:N-6 DNA methylase [candidate division Zixibacteria bacterium]
MLDSETKRRIDTARDILVGKVPDPKSQVEQITIALIYKFMDDMDATAEEHGGKRTFFAGEFQRYSWSKLMAPGLGGHEVLNLYAEAITKMNQNNGIPQLFRDIFKNAFLPYRAPETLKMFLKVIDDFEYDHSERLGDAFEYLLSVLGSQGDAGQFRTPRHIIDFMVEVIDPKKDESVIDPACGTAGFLISSYKHVLKNNAKDGKAGAGLTPDDRAKLAQNIKGYDISPDMVRLSLVNMYLHGFANPDIVEYDTLSSEDKWNEYADVIFANPPFMSPKGGIKPHKRFSVQSNRSEVLFVDYIAEHLSPNGRAAVIVPEGIIFQSGKAYKQLRKMLVEEYLFAVVSLPAGVFKPYSGVKTSILLMDKSFAQKSDFILFVKVANDGFDLGDQRRPIDRDDLPEAHSILQKWQTGKKEESALAQWVEKKAIRESGDYNLTGDRYREAVDSSNIEWPLVKFGDICEIGSSKRVFQSEWKKSGIPFYRAREIVKLAKYGFVENELFISEEMYEDYSQKYGEPQAGDLMVTGVGTLGICYLVKQGDRFYFKDGNIIWFKNFSKRADSTFVKLLIDSDFVKNQISANAAGGTVGTYTITGAKNTLIPLPPLEIQKEIVAEIEGYQKIINGARAVVENYKPQIQIDPEWEIVKLGEVATIISGQSPEGKYYNQNGDGIPFYQGKTEFREIYIDEPKKWTIQVTKEAEQGDILMSVRAPVGPVNLASQRCCIGRGLAAIRATERIKSLFLFYYLKSIESTITGSGGAVFDSINRDQISKLNVPLPSMVLQKKILLRIETERKLVDVNKTLISLFEQKIKDKIASMWGE